MPTIVTRTHLAAFLLVLAMSAMPAVAFATAREMPADAVEHEMSAGCPMTDCIAHSLSASGCAVLEASGVTCPLLTPIRLPHGAAKSIPSFAQTIPKPPPRPLS